MPFISSALTYPTACSLGTGMICTYVPLADQGFLPMWNQKNLVHAGNFDNVSASTDHLNKQAPVMSGDCKECCCIESSDT